LAQADSGFYRFYRSGLYVSDFGDTDLNETAVVCVLAL
jgi:hypothetical protein